MTKHTPNADHPWLRNSRFYKAGVSHRKPGRKLADSLRDEDCDRIAMVEQVPEAAQEQDFNIANFRDPSYTILPEGSGRRKAVRYD